MNVLRRRVKFTVVILILLAAILIALSVSTPIAIKLDVHNKDIIVSRGIHTPITRLSPATSTLFFHSPAEQLSFTKDSYYDIGDSSVHHPPSQPQRGERNRESIPLSVLQSLLIVHSDLNLITSHIRIPNVLQNVSLTPPNKAAESQRLFNPTIMALPYWSQNQYLLVSRVVTEGLHQESLMCEANTCYAGGGEDRRPGEKDCTGDDMMALGLAGGLRCAHKPLLLDIPSTPSEECTGTWASFPDIPGFHDPRIFWSGKGEPLIIVNSHSRYACFGLWVTDLRNLYSPLTTLLSTVPDHPTTKSPLISYPFLTELTRNPRTTRSAIEKNWFLFSPTPSTSYVHYDISPPSERVETSPNGTIAKTFSGGRSFAKLIGNGFTSPNLISPLEAPCLPTATDPLNRTGQWHQASNSLKLILCRRAKASSNRCDKDKTVHFALIHRKFTNDWSLPLRYERFFVVWDTKPPFKMLGMSRYPVQFWNETASGWGVEENRSGMRVEKGSTSSSSSSSSFRFTNATGTPSNNTRSQEFTNATGVPPNNTKSQHKIEANQPNTSNNNKTANPNPNHHSRDRTWSATFTYTPSIAWAWRPKSSFFPSPQSDSDSDSDSDSENTVFETLQTGYLDDDLILGIGVDDTQMVFGRASAETLLQGLRICPDTGDEDVERPKAKGKGKGKADEDGKDKDKEAKGVEGAAEEEIDDDGEEELEEEEDGF